MSFERVVVLASASRRKIYQLDIDFRGKETAQRSTKKSTRPNGAKNNF